MSEDKPVATYHLKELPPSFVVVTPHWFKISKAYQGVVAGDDFPKWSGSIMPPAIGTQVYVNVWVDGAIGVSTVVDYYIEHGWLGVLVAPLKPPKGYVKRHAARMREQGFTGMPVTFHSMGNDLCTVEQHKAHAKARRAAEKLTAKVDDAVVKGKGYAVVGVDFAAHRCPRC